MEQLTPIQILQKLRTETDSVLLFHSATGKDSIVMADMCSKVFKRVECVFMYVVPELEFEEKYIRFTEKKYPNLKFHRTPHYATYSFIKNGYLGIEKNESVKLPTLSKITEQMREITQLSWSIFGFKQFDSVQRRLMLRNYEDGAFMRKTKKVYPLTHWSNKDCEKYIKLNKLPHPVSYGKGRSSGTDITDIDFLIWLQTNYPNDLQKVINLFPMVKQKLFEYEHNNKIQSERNKRT